jgi:GlpG protein
VDASEMGLEIWVYDEDQIAQAKKEWDDFLDDPESEKFQQAKKIARKIHQQKELENKERNRLYVDVRAQRFNFLGNRVTLIMIIASVVIYLLQQFVRDINVVIFLNSLFINHPDFPLFYFVSRGEVWRLVTPIFMHGGLLHILFNMMWLFSLGSLIESRKGPKKLIGIILFIAIVSNVAQYLYAGPMFLGMSGVIFGLLGYIWMKMKFQAYEGIAIERENITFMLIWMVVCMTGFIGPIANACHVVGLLSGISIVYIPYWLKQKNKLK